MESESKSDMSWVLNLALMGVEYLLARREIPYVILEPTRKMVVYEVREMDSENYILLNRDYKPIGNYFRHFINYEDFPQCFVKKSELRKEFLDSEYKYLFNDGTKPMPSGYMEHLVRYCKKLQRTFVNEYFCGAIESMLLERRRNYINFSNAYYKFREKDLNVPGKFSIT